MRYIKQQFFVGVAQFDKNTLKSECLAGVSQAEVEGYFRNWSAHQLALARRTVLNASYVKGIGYWSPSCYKHVMLQGADNYYHSIRAGKDSVRYDEAISNWWSGGDGPTQVWDECTEGEGEYLPCNADCTNTTGPTCPFDLSKCTFGRSLGDEDGGE